MPWPQNYDMANRVEDMVRAHGATPATIAVIEGRIKIGLDQDALKTLAQTQGARKLSRADLAVCLVDGATGATTVAATMILAHLAGIHVFATGGLAVCIAAQNIALIFPQIFRNLPKPLSR